MRIFYCRGILLRKYLHESIEVISFSCEESINVLSDLSKLLLDKSSSLFLLSKIILDEVSSNILLDKTSPNILLDEAFPSFSLDDGSSDDHSSIMIVLSKDTSSVDPSFTSSDKEDDDSSKGIKLIPSTFNISINSLSFFY